MIEQVTQDQLTGGDESVSIRGEKDKKNKVFRRR
jgi:hypothetical protein